MSKSNNYKPQEKRIKRVEKKPGKNIDRELKRINNVDTSKLDDVFDTYYTK